MEFGILTHLYHKIKSLHFTRLIHQAKLATSSCNLCGSAPKTYPLLCDYCVADLPTFNYALIENNLLNWPAIHKALPNHTFDQLYALSPHEWPFSQWISLLKYKGRFDLANLLGKLLYDQWLKSNCQQNMYLHNKNTQSISLNTHSSILVVSVPLHIKKWQGRGYNQAHLIAKNFVLNTSISYAHNAIFRTKNTDTQVGQTGSNRRKNMNGAFELNPDIIWPEHVIIIDDVVTTGTTVNEISSLLKKHGVQTVTVLSVTIALPKK